MKSICAAAFLVLAAVACNKDLPVATTSTTSAEALPPADTNGTTPPPAVPELGKDGQGRARMSAKPRATSSMSDDGLTTTSSIPATDDSEVVAAPAETAVVPPVQGSTTTTTTTTVTTVKKKPVAKPAGDYGTGAARGNGINSTAPGGGTR